MGVHGLTTYLRENKRILSKTYEFPLSDTEKSIPVVVDGWSLLYEVNNLSGLPWVYGGEYKEFADLTERIIQAWIGIGFDLHIVFDGPRPEAKFPTQISRLTQSFIQPSLLFFRTSPTSRTSPRFLNEARIIPPLSYFACLEALQSIIPTTPHLHLHFADEECDPYAVCLAGRLKAYVVGNDSDYIVLNSEGYQGYVPLDEMIWHANVAHEEQVLGDADDDEWQFQTVRRGKSKRPTAHGLTGRGIIPPVEAVSLTLTCTIYSPAQLAAHLKLPITLLPLLGALVGNDFSIEVDTRRRHIQYMFFDKRMTHAQRITHVATTITGILSPSSKGKRSKHAVGSVMDLIDRTVGALLNSRASSMGSGEIEQVIEKVVQATLQYAIPKLDGEVLEQYDHQMWVDATCAVHRTNALCPLLHFVSRRAVVPTEEGDQDIIGIKLREMFLQAYRDGKIAGKLMDTLATGTYWPHLFLENPDFAATSWSIGRSIRSWIYSILHDTLGLPEVAPEEPVLTTTQKSGDGDATDGEGDENELIDVVEADSEDEDILAPLKGALRELHGSDDESVAVSAATSTPAAPPPTKVKEFIRRGGRVAEEMVEVEPLSNLLATLPSASDVLSESMESLLMEPENVRMTVFLEILGADVSSVRGLRSDLIIPAVAIRWVVRTLHSRAQETGSKERESERWTKREACCFLATFANSPAPEIQSPPEITNRNVQLMAQMLTTLEHIHHLAQVLLLSEQLPFRISTSVSGKLVHALLMGAVPLESLESKIVEAIDEGLEGVYAEERFRKSKKTKKSSSNTSGSMPTKQRLHQSGARVRGGLYDLLLDAEA